MDLYQYRYIPCNVVITMGGLDYTFDDGTIAYFSMGHDYVNRRMPVIFMQMEMDDKTIGMIYDNVETAVLKLEIIEKQLDPSTEQVLNTTMFMKHSFNIIPRNEQNTYITSQDSVTQENMDPMRNPQVFEFYLIDKTAVTWFTREITGIFQNASRPDILQALFQMRNIPSNIVIATPPSNLDPIDYILLPLGDLVGNIDTLNKAYGIYDSYPFIYYDMDYLYCINKMRPNVTIKSATDFGTVTVILRNPNKAEHNVSGSYTDFATKTHYFNLNHGPSIIDQSLQDGSTKFATVTTINSAGDIEKATIRNDATKLQYVYAHNDLTMQQVINETIVGHKVSLYTENCCVSFLRPWKSFTFDVDTQYMDLELTGHEYRLVGWKFEIRREGINNFLHTVNMTLIRPTR